MLIVHKKYKYAVVVSIISFTRFSEWIEKGGRAVYILIRIAMPVLHGTSLNSSRMRGWA